MNFIFNHVLKTLIIGGTKEDHDLHFLASKSIVHDFIATKLVPKTVKLT